MIVAAEFDKEQDKIAVVSPDSVLRVFDVARRRLLSECREHDHLTAHYSCLAWGPSTTTSTIPAATPKRKKQATTADGGGGGALIAVGCGMGDVVVWDTATAELRTRLHPGSGARVGVVGVAWVATADSSVLACTADGAVTRWDVATAHPLVHVRCGHDASAMALLPNSSLLVTAYLALRIRPLPELAATDATTSTSTASKKHVKLAASHSAPISLIAAVRGAAELLDARNIVLSCSSTERQIYAWDCGAAASAPLQGFAADAVPVALDALVFEQHQKPVVAVLAVTASGVVNVWIWNNPFEQKKATAATSTQQRVLPPTIRIAAAGRGPNSAPAFSARFSTHTKVLVARGQPTVLPRFDVVDVLGQDGTPIAASIALPEDSAEKQTSKKRPSTTTVTATVDRLAPHEAGALPSATTTVPDETEQTEATLAERIAAEEAAPAMAAAAAGGIRANSMHTALMQAVRTNDQTLLDNCLQVQEPDIINHTIRRLPSQYVVPLLAIVVDKLQSNPARGLALVAWIRAVLAEHMAYLMTIPRVDAALSGLYLMVHSRLETHRAFLKLSGRLDLVLAQVARAQQQGTDATSPLNVITEGDDGEPVAVEAAVPTTAAGDSDMDDEQVQGGADGDDDEEEEENEDEEEEDDMVADIDPDDEEDAVAATGEDDEDAML